MPRLRRVVIHDVPLHITQRGVDRCDTFRCDEDFAYYRWALREALDESGCELHAYALMTNHVHLLVTPRDVHGPARLFKSLGRRYVRHFNGRYRRTGTLWEGRYRSAVVDSIAYTFACCRYIELNPVRARMVTQPNRYRWSSYRHNVEGQTDALISEHPAYVALGRSGEERRAAYRAMFSEKLAPEAIAHVRAAQVSRLGPSRRPGDLALVAAPSHAGRESEPVPIPATG